MSDRETIWTRAFSIEFSVDLMIQRIFNFQPSSTQDHSFELHSRGLIVEWTIENVVRKAKSKFKFSRYNVVLILILTHFQCLHFVYCFLWDRNWTLSQCRVRLKIYGIVTQMAMFHLTWKIVWSKTEEVVKVGNKKFYFFKTLWTSPFT